MVVAGIIAGLLVDLTSVAASDPDGSDAANNLLNLVRTLCDARTLACPSVRRAPNDRETFLVEKRAVKVPKQVPCCGPRSRPEVPQLTTWRSGPIEAKI